MSAYKKLLFMVPVALLPFASFALPSDGPGDAEARYRAKYGRSYPSTERQQMDAARRVKSDKAIASNKKEVKEAEKQQADKKAAEARTSTADVD